MPVFKLSLKIIKKNLPSMIIYLVMFLAILIIFATQSTDQQQTSFEQTKIKMAFISEESSPLLDGFKNHLSQYANFVDVGTSKENLQDALFFRSVEYIVTIPKGFTEAIMSGDTSLQIQKTVVPSSMSGAYIDITIEQYFNTARLYVNNIPGISQEDLVLQLKEDLYPAVAVGFQEQELVAQNQVFAKNFFNYLAYAMFAVLILGISAIMLVMNDVNRKRRNACSPLSPIRINLEFLLAHMCFTVTTWGIMMVFYFIMGGENTQASNTPYFMLNAFVFALCGASISFFIGSLVKNSSSLSAISNVVTLGPCFISGIFVPQELMGDAVLKIASFTPTFWFAKANGIISTLTVFDMAHMKPVYAAMLIEVGFAIAFLAVSMVIAKRRNVIE